MPRKTKAIRWGKVRDNRVLYVSTLIPDYPEDYTRWMTTFWSRLSLMKELHRHTFVGVMRTGDSLAATVLSKRLEDSRITDVVAVLTDLYLNANVGAAGESSGELARFFRAALKKRSRATRIEADLETPIQFFLAPLDPPTWSIPICEVTLDDERLRKLRIDRFTWPSEAPARVVDEVAAAVEAIVRDTEE
jgi:hypothetical protein